MSFPLQPHVSALEVLNAQHLIAVLTLFVSAVWAVAEIWSLPRSRRKLDIPRGDWLSVALGALPVAGVTATNLWQFVDSSAMYFPVLVVPGLVLCVAGISLRVWSKKVLGHFYTFAIGLTDGHRILADGPYRFVRHPVYLGTFLAVMGFPLLTQSWATFWLLTLPTTLVYALRLVKEDAFLARQLGADYQIYARRTARLIPFVW